MLMQHLTIIRSAGVFAESPKLLRHIRVDCSFKKKRQPQTHPSDRPFPREQNGGSPSRLFTSSPVWANVSSFWVWRCNGRFARPTNAANCKFEPISIVAPHSFQSDSRQAQLVSFANASHSLQARLIPVFHAIVKQLFADKPR